MSAPVGSTRPVKLRNIEFGLQQFQQQQQQQQPASSSSSSQLLIQQPPTQNHHHDKKHVHAPGPKATRRHRSRPSTASLPQAPPSHGRQRVRARSRLHEAPVHAAHKKVQHRVEISKEEQMTMAELFPNGVDRQSRPLDYQRKNDSQLSLQAIRQEMALLEGESLNDVFITDHASVDRTPERRRVLERYLSSILEALETWSEYDVARRTFMESRDGMAESDPVETLRFDDEFRRFKARQDSRQLSPRSLRKIVHVKADSAASIALEKIEAALEAAGSPRSDTDPELNQEKLSAEIRQWQTRSIMGTLSPKVSNGIVDSDAFEQMIKAEWDRLSMEEFIDDDVSDDDLDPMEIVIVDNLISMHQSDSGFFVTSSFTDEEEDEGSTFTTTLQTVDGLELDVGNIQRPRPQRAHVQTVWRQGSISSQIKISDSSAVERPSNRYSSQDEEAFDDDDDDDDDDDGDGLFLLDGNPSSPKNRRAFHVGKLMEDLKDQVQNSRYPVGSPINVDNDAPIPVPRAKTPEARNRRSRDILASTESRESIRCVGNQDDRQLVVELERQIGFGGTSRVYAGVVTSTGEQVAVKKITVSSRTSRKVVRLEIDILKQLDHPNLVRYRGCRLTKNDCYIVMEYVAGGSLEQKIINNGPMMEHEAALILLQVLRGVVYLHERGILHRDLKPGNILITEDGRTAKLADFGVSAQLTALEDTRTSCTGTPWFVAPEVVKVEPYSYQADVWSIGSTCFEMVSGERPWGDLNHVSAMYKIVTQGHPSLDGLDLSDECRDFLLSCWIHDWKKRPSASELLKHPWIQMHNTER